MLGKLIKHEFRATGRTMLPVLGVVLILSLLGNISFRSFEYTDTYFIHIVVGLIIFASLAGMVAAAVVALVVMINRFYKNVLGEEGYLTMTLPVSTHAIIWSKIIVSFLWFFFTAVVVALAMFFTVVSFSHMDLADIFSNLPPLSEAFDSFYAFTGFNGATMTVFIIEVLAFSFVAAIVTCLHFYAAMSIGHGFKNKKVLMSVVSFIVISFVFQLLTIYIVPSAVLPSGEAYYEVQLCTELTRLVLAGLAVNAVKGVILYFITVFNLKKRLNLA